MSSMDSSMSVRTRHLTIVSMLTDKHRCTTILSVTGIAIFLLVVSHVLSSHQNVRRKLRGRSLTRIDTVGFNRIQ